MHLASRADQAPDFASTEDAWRYVEQRPHFSDLDDRCRLLALTGREIADNPNRQVGLMPRRELRKLLKHRVYLCRHAGPGRIHLWDDRGEVARHTAAALGDRLHAPLR